MFAKNLVVLVLISLLMLTNAQQTNEELRSLQQSALRSLQQTDDYDNAATNSKCMQSMMADSLSGASAYMELVLSGKSGVLTVSLSDKTCGSCYEEKGYCLTESASKKTNENKKNNFYDCVEGGETVKLTTTDDYTDDQGQKTTSTTTMATTYCQLKPNGSYYAVIIVPVLAFSFMLMGLAYYFRKVRGKSSSTVVASTGTEVVIAKAEPV